MRLHIKHNTNYTYETPVQNSIQYLRLTPRNTPQQRILEWTLTTPGETSQMTDGFGNLVTVMTLDEPVSDITLTAEGVDELPIEAALQRLGIDLLIKVMLHSSQARRKLKLRLPLLDLQLRHLRLHLRRLRHHHHHLLLLLPPSLIQTTTTTTTKKDTVTNKTF